MKSDIEIAQEATLLPIKEVAANIGIKEDDLELYGKYKAKFDSHFMDEVEALCDEICILKKGKAVFYGTVEQAKKASGCEKFEDAYLMLFGEVVEE